MLLINVYPTICFYYEEVKVGGTHSVILKGGTIEGLTSTLSFQAERSDKEARHKTSNNVAGC